MKKINFIINTLVILVIAFGVITIQSCSKDEVINPSSEDEFPSDMISFDSPKEYSATLEKVISMSLDELKTYEDSKGYKSFGRKCDELYASINFDDFESFEELKAFVESNSEYLKLVEDEEGELVLETTLSSSPYRYFTNNDKLFRIMDKVYKVFEDGVVATSFDNIEKLKSLNVNKTSLLQSDENFRIMPTRYESNISGAQLKDAPYNCGTHANARKTNGKNRTKIEISINYLDTYDINGFPMTIYENRVLIRPYKKTLGIWYWCSRTLSCDIKVAIDVNTTSGWVRGFYYESESGKHDSKLEYIMSGGIVSMGYWARYDMHYGGYDCWADSPSTDHCHLECNKILF